MLGFSGVVFAVTPMAIVRQKYTKSNDDLIVSHL
jgi:hypothetical protein